MRVTIALVLVCAAVVIAPASATQSGGNPTPIAEPQHICNQSESHAALHRKTARKNWRDPKPLAGTNLCIPRKHVAKHMTGFRRWQAYRNVAPYAGCSSGGKWLRWTAIPGSVVFRESRCSWSAYNPSGACGPYQLLGWTSCATSSWSDKIRHHRMAAYVLRVQGPGAWVAW
jgi:hypothetical protein